ncbi:hypothetical protein ABTL62_19455, partial [Acinetobacter baumannii]
MSTAASTLQFTGQLPDRATEILTPEAVAFVAGLQAKFGKRRLELLAAREVRQARYDA